jgi:hypothetical protein
VILFINSITGLSEFRSLEHKIGLNELSNDSREDS